MSFTLRVVDAAHANAYKAMLAANATGVAVTVADATGALPFGATVALEVSGRSLYGANAICRFFSLQSGKLNGSTLSVDHWVEWEATKLQAASANAQAAAAQLEAALTGAFLVGSALSLADVVVAATTSSLLAAGTLDAAAFPKVAAHAASVTGSEAGVSARTTLKSLNSLEDPKSNENVLLWLEDAFTIAAWKAFPGVKEKGFKRAMVTTAPKFAHHYQCNSIMKIISLTRGNRKETAAAAQKLVDAFPRTQVVDRLEVNPRGFINIYIAKAFLQGRIAGVLQSGSLAAPPCKRLRVVVDYSSPNIAKEMHVGHLRSTILGDTLARILEFAGHEVLRVNHVGDWGTQFGMLIAHLKDQAADGGETSVADLTAFYKQAKARFDAEEEFKLRAKREVVKLQAGDEENTRLWKSICATSEKMFTRVYRRLGIDPRLEVVGESFYNDVIPGLLKEVNAKGMVSDSDGAQVIFVEGHKVPLMLVKSDGGIGYDSTDLAALHHRSQVLKADWAVYVVDSGQSQHFEIVFKAAKKAGWTDNIRVDHVGFGVVCGEDGKKFKTRSGETVRLVDLLDKARDMCKEELVRRAEEGGTLVDAADIQSTSEALGYGGVKYFDLRQNRLSNYKFSYKRMLARNGDTAVYMQYSHARIASIVRKAGVDVATFKAADLNIEHPAEIELAFEVSRFGEVITAIQGDLMPHRLTEYLWTLSNKFSDFYANCRVVGEDSQASRLALCHITAITVRTCMELLGITPVDRL